MRRAALLGTLAALCAVVWWLFPSPTLVPINLVDQLPQATRGPLVAFQGALGSTAAGPFLDFGWGACRDHIRSTFHRNPKGSRLRFVVDPVAPLKVSLEGRAERRCQPEIYLNDTFLWRVQLEPEWRFFRFELPPQLLRCGSNSLEIREESQTHWRQCNFSLTQAGLDDPPAEADQLLVPFGKSLAFAVDLAPRSRFLIEELSAAVQPGSPRPPGRLQVRLRNGQSGQEQNWELALGRRHELTLCPALSRGCRAELTLLALGPQAPLPGQIGLRLRKPLVLAAEPPPAEVLREQPRQQRRRPNVVLYLIDTLRADHLGCYGYARATSPHIDALAKDGVLFENFTAQSTWTKPATASILTSLGARRHGAMDFGDQLHASSRLVSQYFQAAGYETRAFSTNPFVSKTFGFDRGFDQFELQPHLPSARVHEALRAWLAHPDRKKRPFFLYVHTIDPHLPYGPIQDQYMQELATESVREAYNGRGNGALERRLQHALAGYDGEITQNDAAFGQLTALLKAQGLYDNTVVAVTSDHGEEFLEHRAIGHNHSLYQELLAVPWIIKFPGSQAKGTRIGPLWQQIDVAPTLLEAAGLPRPPHMEGQAYIPNGPSGDPQRPAFFSLTSGVDAERWGQGKEDRFVSMDGVRWGDWVLNFTWASRAGYQAPRELFDLKTDPAQQHRLQEQRPEVAVRLAGLLWLRIQHSNSASSRAQPAQVESTMRSLQYLR